MVILLYVVIPVECWDTLWLECSIEFVAVLAGAVKPKTKWFHVSSHEWRQQTPECLEDIRPLIQRGPGRLPNTHTLAPQGLPYILIPLFAVVT